MTHDDTVQVVPRTTKAGLESLPLSCFEDKNSYVLLDIATGRRHPNARSPNAPKVCAATFLSQSVPRAVLRDLYFLCIPSSRPRNELRSSVLSHAKYANATTLRFLMEPSFPALSHFFPPFWMDLSVVLFFSDTSRIVGTAHCSHAAPFYQGQLV